MEASLMGQTITTLESKSKATVDAQPSVKGGWSGFSGPGRLSEEHSFPTFLDANLSGKVSAMIESNVRVRIDAKPDVQNMSSPLTAAAWKTALHGRLKVNAMAEPKVKSSVETTPNVELESSPLTAPVRSREKCTFKTSLFARLNDTANAMVESNINTIAETTLNIRLEASVGAFSSRHRRSHPLQMWKQKGNSDATAETKSTASLKTKPHANVESDATVNVKPKVATDREEVKATFCLTDRSPGCIDMETFLLRGRPLKLVPTNVSEYAVNLNVTAAKKQLTSSRHAHAGVKRANSELLGSALISMFETDVVEARWQEWMQLNDIGGPSAVNVTSQDLGNAFMSLYDTDVSEARWQEWLELTRSLAESGHEHELANLAQDRMLAEVEHASKPVLAIF